MATLPNARAAILDISKLSDYCLDAAHRRGRNKARVFQAALGIAKNDAGWLRAAILDAIPNAEAFQEEVDKFGVRWRADVRLVRHGRQVVVRTVWIFRTAMLRLGSSRAG
jgi:hypothetical protein